MLMLGRKVGETVCIGDNIRVTVNRVNGERVYLAIDAPRRVVVDREEIWERKQRERKESE